MKEKENFFQKFTGSLTVENIRERVQWLVFLRWIAGVVVVMAVLSMKAFTGTQQIVIPLILGVFILIYNGIFEFIRRYFYTHPETSELDIKRRMAFINIQIFIDLVVLAALVYFTGGIANPFLYFFIFHMVISSILLSRLNAYLWSFFTIFLESILFFLEHFEYIPSQPFLPGYHDGLVSNGTYVFFILISFSVTMVITVYFATSIMRPIRKRQLDLTELQNRLEKKRDLLEEKNRELSEVDRSKTEFLYRVEHELKAPIGALQSLLSVVSRGYASVNEEKKKELLERAEKRVQVMKELVTDLLSLSRITERSFELDIEAIHIKEIVAEAINDLNTYSAKREITIVVEADPFLPTMHADRHAVDEITRNLIHNAVKYSFQGVVNVRLAVKDQSIIFQVSDSGIGISEEDLQQIFKEFYRTANAKAFEEGSGLGLSLVKRLVEEHGGTIAVESQLNQGTTFTVSMPILSEPVRRKSILNV